MKAAAENHGGFLIDGKNNTLTTSALSPHFRQLLISP